MPVQIHGRGLEEYMEIHAKTGFEVLRMMSTHCGCWELCGGDVKTTQWAVAACVGKRKYLLPDNESREHSAGNLNFCHKIRCFTS